MKRDNEDEVVSRHHPCSSQTGFKIIRVSMLENHLTPSPERKIFASSKPQVFSPSSYLQSREHHVSWIVVYLFEVRGRLMLIHRCSPQTSKIFAIINDDQHS